MSYWQENLCRRNLATKVWAIIGDFWLWPLLAIWMFQSPLFHCLALSKHLNLMTFVLLPRRAMEVIALSRALKCHGKFCASHPWEVIVGTIILIVTVLSFSSFTPETVGFSSRYSYKSQVSGLNFAQCYYNTSHQLFFICYCNHLKKFLLNIIVLSLLTIYHYLYHFYVIGSWALRHIYRTRDNMLRNCVRLPAI